MRKEGLLVSVLIVVVIVGLSYGLLTGNVVADYMIPSGENVLLYLPMDGDVLDGSGNGNDGTINGDVDCSVEGRIGKGCRFNDDGGYILFGQDNIVGGSSAMSVSIWFKNDQIGSPSGNAFMIIRGGNGWDLHLDTQDYLAFGVCNSSYVCKDARSEGFSDVTSWHHIVGVYDGSAVKLYLDGVLQNSQSQTGNVVIRNTGLTVGKGWNGILDEAVLWDKALSANEVLELYNAEVVVGEEPEEIVEEKNESENETVIEDEIIEVNETDNITIIEEEEVIEEEPVEEEMEEIIEEEVIAEPIVEEEVEEEPNVIVRVIENIVDAVVGFFVGLFDFGTQAVGEIYVDKDMTGAVDGNGDCIDQYDPSTRVCGSGGIETAFDFVQDGADVADTPGDIVYIIGASSPYYSIGDNNNEQVLRVKFSGSEGLPIIFQGIDMGDGYPVLDGRSGPTMDEYVNDYVVFTTHNWTVFSKFVIQRAERTGIYLDKVHNVLAEDLIIQNNSIRKKTRGLSPGFFAYESINVTLRRSIARNNVWGVLFKRNNGSMVEDVISHDNPADPESFVGESCYDTNGDFVEGEALCLSGGGECVCLNKVDGICVSESPFCTWFVGHSVHGL